MMCPCAFALMYVSSFFISHVLMLSFTSSQTWIGVSLCWQAWGHIMHSKHVESSIRRHDVKHEDTFTQTMWEWVMVDMTTLLSDLVGHLYRIKILTPEMDVFRRMGSGINSPGFQAFFFNYEYLVQSASLTIQVWGHMHICIRTHTHIHKDTCTYA